MNGTFQTSQWASDFGRQYTDRNPQTPAEMDLLYQDTYGLTRTALNQEFLRGMDPAIRILEAGCNVGAQLQALQAAGFRHLYGVELQPYAVRKAKTLTQDINIIQGTAADMPFRDSYFDLVFTSGLLIHVPPEQLPAVMNEIYRCSRRYIWGFEYFSDTHTEIPYRGNAALMWKGDFAKMFCGMFPGIRLAKQRLIPYLANARQFDCMFLLEKGRWRT